MVTATRAALRLCLSLGFRPGPTVFQHQGTVVAAPTVVPGARPMVAADEAAVRALDAAALTAERRAVLDELLAVSEGTVVERRGEVVGFALCRRFGRGHVVGPVVAASEADAAALVAPHVAAHAGRFLRLDTREGEGLLRTYLEECGLSLFDTGTSMSRGRDRVPEGPARIYGLGSHSLG